MINKIKTYFTVFLLFFITACAEEKKANDNLAEEGATIVVGTSADYPPFEFIQNGEIVGFDIDLVNAISSELKSNVVIKDMPFNSLILALQNNDIDMIISATSVTEKRSENVDFSNVYYNNKISIIYDSTKQQNLNSINDLVDKKVAVQTGSTMQSFIDKYSKDNSLSIDVIPLDNNLISIEELKMGRVDAIIFEKAQANKFAKDNNDLKVIDVDNTDNYGYAIILPKNSTLKNEINRILEKFLVDGKLSELENKWIEKGDF